MREPIRDVLTGRSFIGGDTSSASAGNFSHVQLWHPAATGKVLVVTRVMAWAQASINASIRKRTTSLTNNVGAPENRNLGGAASVAQIREVVNGAVLGDFMARARLIDAPHVIAEGPFAVLPSNGLIVAGSTVNNAIIAWFEWLEIDA